MGAKQENTKEAQMFTAFAVPNVLRRFMDIGRKGQQKERGTGGQMMFIDSYFSLSSMRRFWRDVCHHPDGKGGAYFKSSQRKSRKMARRLCRWRKRG